MPPKFSIIIPVYNVAPYLRRCLDSVCVAVERVGNGERGTDVASRLSALMTAQLMGRGKFLMNTLHVSTLQPFNHSTFRVIHQENQGVAVARQVALEQCTGDWICAVDPDDWVEPDFLKAFYDAFRLGLLAWSGAKIVGRFGYTAHGALACSSLPNAPISGCFIYFRFYPVLVESEWGQSRSF